MSRPKPPATHPLETFRLGKYWSYQRLADEIHRVTGLRLDQSAWRRICRREATPKDTTQHAINQFLGTPRAAGASR